MPALSQWAAAGTGGVSGRSRRVGSAPARRLAAAVKYRLWDRSGTVRALSHRTWTPVPASQGDGQVHAADLQRAGVGGAQLDKEHGRVRAGAGDHAGVHVVSVTAKATAGHREFCDFGYGYCRPAERVASIGGIRHHAAPGVAEPWEPSSFVGRRPGVDQARLLLEGSRRMMLVVPGGLRKTRLVTRVATAVERSFPAGPAFAELGALPDRRSPTVGRWPSPTLRRRWTRLVTAGRL